MNESKKAEADKIKLRQEDKKLKSTENDLKVANKALEKINEETSKLEKENKSLKSAAGISDNKFKVIELEYENLKEIERKSAQENKELRVQVEEMRESCDDSMNQTLEGQLKVKNLEIKSLTFSRKISVDNVTKLQRFNQELQQEIKDLKVQKKIACKENESDNPYPCDKCNKNYKTAGLLVKHVKIEHENLPDTRP